MYKNDKANTTPFISLIIDIAHLSKNLTEKKFILELSDITSKVIIFTIYTIYNIFLFYLKFIK